MIVLVVGVGGLGCPLALALGGAGAHLRLVDDDTVDLSNLPRQVLYRSADVGRPKALAARDALARRGIAADALCARFDPAQLAGADVVCEGSDNLATKFQVNDACRAAGLPFVIAGVLRHGGQVFPVRPFPAFGDACYRCLFEEPPADEAPSCAEAGVLGPTCGRVAAWQARAALALAGGEDPHGLLGRVWLFDKDDVRSLAVRPRPGCCAPPQEAHP